MQHVKYINTLKGKYSLSTLKGEPWLQIQAILLCFFCSLILDFVYFSSLSRHLIGQSGD